MDLKVLISVGVLLAVGVAALFVVQFGSAPSNNQPEPLFERLGGLPALSAVVEAFAQRLFDDPQLEPFFGGLSEQRQARFVQLNIEFMCMATGGPCQYTGRSMFDSHRGLGTTNNVFDVVKNHLVGVLGEFNVPRPLQRELLDLVETTRADIVE